MGGFTNEQVLEIKKIVNDVQKIKNLNWQIVQSLPEIPIKNTLYFLQTSQSPRLFEIYHTDKDGDLAQLSNQYTVEGDYNI